MANAPIATNIPKFWKGKPLTIGIASLFVPGLGQWFNRQRLKALIWLLIPLFILAIELGTSQWGRYLELKQGKVPPEALATQAYQNTIATQEVTSSQSDYMSALFGDSRQGEQTAGSGDPFADSTNAQENTIPAPAGSGDPFAQAAASEENKPGSTPETNAEQGNYFNATYVYPNYRPGEPHYPIRDFGGFFTRGIWGLVTLGRLTIDQPYAGGYIELYNKISPWLSADNSIVLLGNGLICLAVLLILGLLWVLGALDAYSTRKRILSTGQVERFGDFWKRTWNSLYVYIVSAPAFVLIIMFTVIPIFFTFLLAFTNYTYKIKLGAKLIEWVGFGTFSYLAMDPGWLSIFGQIFLWTIFWAFMSSFTVYGLGFVNAMIVESPLVRYKKFWRTIMILPWAIPSLVSLMMFRNAFDKDGLVNQFLFATGLMEPVSKLLFNIGLAGQADQPIFWFQPIYNGKLARFVVILVNLWLGAPYHMMMITGVLSTIPKELYEAAAIDGASGSQRFRYITLPMVLSATVPALIMTFSFNFNNFGAVYFLTGGGPVWDPAKVPDSMRIVGSAMPGQTDILISWIYKLSFTKGFEQYNVAAVYSIIIFMIVGGFSVFNLLRSKSFREEAGE